MEFGTFTFIIPDTFFNSVKKYMDYELEPDQNSQLLFTHDNEPGIVKEFVVKSPPKMKKMYCNTRGQVFPQIFQFQIKKGSTLFFEDTPEFSLTHGEYVLKSLNQLFHGHTNQTNYKPSIYNCVYYINDPTKQNVFSILKIGPNRYLFAYEPKYLDKTEVEQIVFDLFIS